MRLSYHPDAEAELVEAAITALAAGGSALPGPLWDAGL
jgi:hypothetical protein